jgi:glyoxylase-like metal-dependent hydrolase (beta-lactamase superfamily II)
VHLPEQRILIAADMLSDIEVPGLDDRPDIYRSSLDALLPVAHGGAIETLVPGHGAIAYGPETVLARITGDLAYLRELEASVSEALTRGLPLETARETLAAMDYTGRRSQIYPTETMHMENIAFAYRGLTESRPLRP